MERAENTYRFIDLTLLNDKGRNKMLKFYNELLQKFPKKESYSGKELQSNIRKLADFNNEKNITIPPDIDISGLTDEMYDGIL